MKARTPTRTSDSAGRTGCRARDAPQYTAETQGAVFLPRSEQPHGRFTLGAAPPEALGAAANGLSFDRHHTRDVFGLAGAAINMILGKLFDFTMIEKFRRRQRLTSLLECAISGARPWIDSKPIIACFESMLAPVARRASALDVLVRSPWLQNGMTAVEHAEVIRHTTARALRAQARLAIDTAARKPAQSVAGAAAAMLTRQRWAVGGIFHQWATGWGKLNKPLDSRNKRNEAVLGPRDTETRK